MPVVNLKVNTVLRTREVSVAQSLTHIYAAGIDAGVPRTGLGCSHALEPGVEHLPHKPVGVGMVGSVVVSTDKG